MRTLCLTRKYTHLPLTLPANIHPFPIPFFEIFIAYISSPPSPQTQKNSWQPPYPPHSPPSSSRNQLHRPVTVTQLPETFIVKSNHCPCVDFLKTKLGRSCRSIMKPVRVINKTPSSVSGSRKVMLGTGMWFYSLTISPACSSINAAITYPSVRMIVSMGLTTRNDLSVTLNK